MPGVPAARLLIAINHSTALFRFLGRAGKSFKLLDMFCSVPPLTSHIQRDPRIKTASRFTSMRL